jgi:hypothetical protein
MSISVTHPRKTLRTRRAARLNSPRCRRKLAAALNRAVRDAEQPPAPFTAAVPLQRREILAARGEIERLAHDLAGPDQVHARGVVLVKRLLTDGASPLYMPGPDGMLEEAVQQAHTALFLD